MDFAQALHVRAPGLKLQKNVTLAPFTTMRVGGPADFFAEVSSPAELAAVCACAADTATPVLVIGNGSNLLVKDGGFEGVAVNMGELFAQISVEDERITAQAGALLSAVARRAMESSLTGLEFASGIPGSVGGATYMNAGAYGGELSQVIGSVDVFEDGKIVTVSLDEMRFGYRKSRLMETGGIALSTVFHLAKGDKDTILSRMNELNARRREKQPLSYPSCGSFFKRPQGYYAGALIEGAGLKGFHVGGAQVSQKHAGFIVNAGGATAKDILELVKCVQNKVFETSGVHLEPEARIVGRDQ